MQSRAVSRGKLGVVLVASLAIQTCASFGNQIVGPLAPALRADLGFSSSSIGLLLSAYYLGAIVLMLPFGIATDRVGPRRLFLIGGAIIFASLWAASRVDSLAVLLTCMFFAGIGNSASLPTTTRAIMDWFTADGGRATAMSIKQTGVALAGVIAAVVVPLVVGPLGWRGVFAAAGIIMLGCSAFFTLVYPAGSNPDIVRKAGHAERAKPTAPPGVRRQFVAIAAYTFGMAGVQLAFQSFFVLFLRDQMHYPLALAGVLLALAQGSGVAARIGWSVVSDAFFGRNRKPGLTAIAGGALAATLGLAFSSQQTPLAAIVVLAILFGASAIGWNGIVMVFVAESAGIERAGIAASINLISSYVAIFAVPPIFGAIVDLTHGFRFAFVALALLTVVSAACVVPMRERVREGFA